MEELDLQAIWQQGAVEADLPSVAQAAEQQRKQSLDLVARIKSTARREHRLFLIASAIGIAGLLFFGLYYWALGLALFSILMIWKYEVEMRLFHRIKVEDSTLAYLQAISRLLQQFMRNYRIGILIFIPLIVIGGSFLGQWLATGSWDWTIWQQPVRWLLLAGSILVGILLSKWWLNFWVNSLYGRKLLEMEEMIEELLK